MFVVGIYSIASTQKGSMVTEPAAPVVNGTSVGAPRKATNSRSRTILGAQVGLIGLAMFVTSSSVRSLQAKQGLPAGNQLVGWLVLISSLIIPLIPHKPAVPTLLLLFLTFSPTFILLTISYEGLFFNAFTLLLYLWTSLESRIPNRTFLDSLRTSLFFFFLLQSGFFSTGNIASISSFSLDSVYRLIPIFSPFAMTVLLLYKILVPFVMISAALAALNGRRDQNLASSSSTTGVTPKVITARRQLPSKLRHLVTAGSDDGKAIFMLATAVSDVLTLNFFWMVKDEGSWLEIGSTISNFCIGGLLGVFITGLELGAGVFSGGSKRDEGKHLADREKENRLVNEVEKKVPQKDGLWLKLGDEDAQGPVVATGSPVRRSKRRSGK